MPPQPGNNSAATNAKPRDTIAGLRGTATAGGFVSSRHRDACRRVMAGVWVVLSVVSSIEFLHGRLQQRLTCPAGKRAVALLPPPGLVLRPSGPGQSSNLHRGWLLPARFRYTRRRGAHNGGTSLQQPDHHWLVWEPVPNRTSEALSVDSCCATASSHSGKKFCGLLMWINPRKFTRYFRKEFLLRAYIMLSATPGALPGFLLRRKPCAVPRPPISGFRRSARACGKLCANFCVKDTFDLRRWIED